VPAAPAPLREPYRALFPLGAGLAACAVLPFAAGGPAGSSLALFHSVAQVQGFLTCFLVGFLYTFVPRHTGTGPPDAGQLVAALLLPTLATGFAFAGEQALAQIAWLALAAVVLVFAVQRLARGYRAASAPPALLWVPVSVAAGACGAALVAASSQLELRSGLATWIVGRGLLVQGLVAGLVLGVGSVVVPRLTRGEEVPLPSGAGRRRRALLGHAAASLVFFATFPLEGLGYPRPAMAVRAVVALAVLVAVARVHRPPTLPGLHRWLVWAAAWLVPLGFCMGALAPRLLRGAALHVVFVGGFAQLTLALSADLVLTDSAGRHRGSSWAVRGMAVLLAGAFAARILAGLDLRRVSGWLTVAALAFLGALASWAAAVSPALRGRYLPSRAWMRREKAGM
jgi:uncharacterized protein involved in response to NO